ncbi:acyl-phosphate glycerol 3-phosphate acyltransferase [Gilliamella sp. Choc4-2]|jgi:1-acyl-sn-glycerol-3-phosphate acyltransferase|uniref:1-acylglycerol-3-phosphate O-acyltransferase n=1 Tax=unclassified Gilliamella TaxID=2685620 RepID=UPI0004DD38E8|nr:1-acylglycerol-3-phosphate O-acyltransferase [Gilliamella apicola]KFA58904.1 1-acyl-sn-glycerol-3-phosphate acyltransferase [Gilliamella apicola]OCG32866.1 acyl-phosphate glycerol 3-phosphate acyltransferase [Gilliamella apicola]OCG45746.1 acyl-phosphate glycerol 3-phosphate acyltransferase [Gilliamella apicola]OCG56164.1 acyl-phosphate glycerol 3-phosphate acyltransferase [Gilliamella apicola]OCG65023.1 acyl-phosphate glycerol 3-phosphate acyltransferase [Gilliamella apicola]
MVFLFRLISVVLIGIVTCVLGIIFCIFNPHNPKNVARFAHLFSFFFKPILGIKVYTRINANINKLGSYVYVANHQNNYDMVVAADVVQPKTVTVGKKSLAWIPFFGQLYYLTGNILIDRNNKSKAHDTIRQVVNEIKKHDISIWMFPEGTRSHGRGLLPFKTGAFKAAIAAGVPIVPICVSDTNNINLNRLNNGHMIVEMLDPIETKNLRKEDARLLMEQCYQQMASKITQINNEVEQLNNQK